MNYGKSMTKFCRNNHKKKKSKLRSKRDYLVLENKNKSLVPESKSKYQLLKNYSKVVYH